MDILTLVVGLLHFLGTVESIGEIFEQIPGLNGVHSSGSFLIYYRINSYITCGGRCILDNTCVTFVYHFGDMKCYLYDWPLTSNTSGITFPGGSVAYWITHDVVVPGSFLSHYIPHKHEVWYFSLAQPINRWTDARSKCLELGGEMPQLLGNDIYDVLNDLDAVYPNVLQAGDYDGYWIAMTQDGSENWVNVDGSSAEPLLWHQWQPDNGPAVDCGAISHDKNNFPSAIPIFKLDDLKCVEIAQWAARYVCRFTDL